jgi:Flp pilus assembly pilin Flp
MEKIWKFIKDEDGLETAEWALMGALVLIAAIAAITTLGGGIKQTFETIAGHFPAGGAGS